MQHNHWPSIRCSIKNSKPESCFCKWLSFVNSSEGDDDEIDEGDDNDIESEVVGEALCRLWGSESRLRESGRSFFSVESSGFEPISEILEPKRGFSGPSDPKVGRDLLRNKFDLLWFSERGFSNFIDDISFKGAFCPGDCEPSSLGSDGISGSRFLNVTVTFSWKFTTKAFYGAILSWNKDRSIDTRVISTICLMSAISLWKGFAKRDCARLVSRKLCTQLISTILPNVTDFSHTDRKTTSTTKPDKNKQIDQTCSPPRRITQNSAKQRF